MGPPKRIFSKAYLTCASSISLLLYKLRGVFTPLKLCVEVKTSAVLLYHYAPESFFFLTQWTVQTAIDIPADDVLNAFELHHQPNGTLENYFFINWVSFCTVVRNY